MLKKYGIFWLALCLLVFTTWVLYLSFKQNTGELTVAVLDVGQGDAIFIESPTGTQLLVDGGPPRKVIGKLSKLMSPLDRRIDAIVITNPDQDHIGGFTDILKKYKVDQVFEPGTANDSTTYKNLQLEIENKNIQNILAKSGMRLDIGGGAYIDILFPDRDVSDWSTNDGSIVARLTYGETSVMLTGDSTAKTEEFLLKGVSASVVDSDILKVGHHGSRTSTTEEFVKAVSPEYALISLGSDNKYGHPHKDTLQTLAELGVKVFRTDLDGSIIMKSNGEKSTFSFSR